jgi:hypothetical protein
MRAHHLQNWLAVACMIAVSPVSAQEACIVCTGPEQAYLCSVEKSDKVRKLPAAEKAIHYACIKEMARIGGHETCRVRRDADIAYCNGLAQTVLLSDLLEAAEQQETAAKENAPQLVQKPAPAKLPPGSSPPDAPKTMVELARRANQQSAEQMQQAGNQVKSAGEKVGGAVQKTWECMTSLFQRC